VQRPSLNSTEVAALTAVLAYWEGRWDWECPLLFGLELPEYRVALAQWRVTSDAVSLPQVALAMNGALREFLYGASAVKAEAVAAIAGMPKSDLVALAHRIGPFVLAVVERRRTA